MLGGEEGSVGRFRITKHYSSGVLGILPVVLLVELLVITILVVLCATGDWWTWSLSAE